MKPRGLKRCDIQEIDMKKVKIMVLLCSGLFLSACAPAILGGQASAPVVSNTALSPLHAKAGQTVYVQYTYPQTYLDVPDRHFDSLVIDFDSTNFVSGNVNSQETPAPWLSMTSKGLPATWQLSLADAAVRKEIVKTTTSGNAVDVRYYNRMRVVYKITVPTNASGAELAELQFKDDGSDIGTADMSIIVDK